MRNRPDVFNNSFYSPQEYDAISAPTPGYGSGITGFLTSPEISQGLIGAGQAILNSGYRGDPAQGIFGFNEGMQKAKQQRLENAYKSLSAKSMLGGGATGVLVRQYMNATGADYPTALMAIKSNLPNQGLQYTQDGVTPLPGFVDSKAQIAGAEAGAKQNAQNQSDFTFKPAISQKEAAAKVLGEKEGVMDAKSVGAPATLSILDQAETLLPKATGGMLQNAISKGNQALDRSTEATKADSQLDILANNLTLNVPRMEGPQGVLDLQLYQKTAGDLANRNMSRGDRLAAIQTLRALTQKYSGNQTVNLGSPNQPRARVYNRATGKFE